jgi:hypothetical protein
VKRTGKTKKTKKRTHEQEHEQDRQRATDL